MKKELEKVYDPARVEDKTYQFWEEGGYFHAEVEPDKQGRILIPEHLRKYAGLEKEITIAGVSSRAEIWDTARWEANNLLLTPEAIAEAMDEMGF